MRLHYLVAAMGVLAATACVDEGFRLDKVSTEVAIGGDVTVLPLGYLEKQKLGDFVKPEDLEGLRVDENGNYSLFFDGEGDEISIDGIETTIEIEKTVATFSAEYPQFELTGSACSINESFGLTPNFGQLDIRGLSSIASTASYTTTIAEGVTVPIPAGYTITAEKSGSISEVLRYSVPEYLSAIKRIYLQPQKSGEKGARIDVSLQLKDLATINGGGNINLELILNDGYEIYGKDGKALKVVSNQGGVVTYQIADGYKFASGANEVKFTVYVASIANSSTITNGVLSLPIELGYNVSFDLTTRANTLRLENLPELQLDATLQYQDADIVLNEVVLLERGAMADDSSPISIDNLPKEVKSVKKVAFSNNSPLQIMVEGLDWLKDATAEHIIIEATLPNYLSLRDNKQGGYDAATHTLRATLSDLRRNIRLNLDALDFGSSGLVPKNGSVDLDFTPEIAAYIEKGTEVRLSDILSNNEIEFSAGIDASTLELVLVEGKIAYQYDETTTITMGGLDEEVELSIADAGVLPIITINVENPLTIDAKVAAALTPVCGGELNHENKVIIKDVVIKAAQVVDGALQNSVTTLVLADESLRGDYADAKYSFVACDVTKLLAGNIPDEVVLDVSFTTDENTTYSIFVTDNYSVKYDYNVNIPLAFNDKMDIAIEHTSDGLADTFEEVADMNISIKGVTLVAEVGNTIPLDFAFDAELLDAQGNPTAVSLDIPKGYNTIKGSADGKTEKSSTLRLGLNLGQSGNVSQLASVDAMRMSLKAKRSAEESCALNAEQYITLKIKLEVNGKIKADLDDMGL